MSFSWEIWEPVSRRVLEALLNGAAQGLVVAALVWLGLRLMPRSNAATRYAAGFAGLLIIATLPFIAWARNSFRNPSNAPASEVRVEVMELSASPEPFAAEPSLEPAAAPEPDDPLPSTLPFSLPFTGPATDRPEWTLSMPPSACAAILGVLLLISLGRIGVLAWQLLLLQLIKHRGHVASEALRERFDLLRRQMGVRRRVLLGLSDQLRAPIAAGFFRPMVLLPAALEDTEDPTALDGILRHELAHVYRWDDWTNLVQQLLHSFLFFHPGLWWLSKRLNIEREIACDDHALAMISSRREYALLLAEFAGRMHCRDWAAAPGAWSKKGQIKERINMILNSKRNASTRLAGASAGVLTAGAAIVALLVMQNGPRVAFAEDAPSAGVAVNESVETNVNVDVDPAVTVNPDVDLHVEAPKALPGAGGSASGSVIVSSDGRSLVATSGPRYKTGAVLAAPRAPKPPGAAALALPPPTPLLVESEDIDLTAPPEPPPARAPRNRELERRLDRLERMVEKLSGDRDQSKSKDKDKEKEKNKDNPFERSEDMHWDFHFKTPDFDKLHEKMARLNEQFQYKFNDDQWKMNSDQWKHIQEESKKAAELAARAGERAAREAERAMRDAERQFNLKFQKDNRQMLEARRDALQHELEEIEHQIERIEQDKDRAERDHERAERDQERVERNRERAAQDRERAEKDRPRAEKERAEERENQDEAPKRRAN